VLDPKKLRILREVAVHGGITKAARSLRVSPASISQHISRLEHDYAVTLIEKAGRGVQLSALALQLVSHAENVLGILEKAEAEILVAREHTTATIHIGSFQTFAAGYLPLMIQNMKRDFPAIRVKFSQLEPDIALTELLARRMDLVVADEYPGISLPPTPGVLRKELGSEPIWIHVPAVFETSAEAVWALEPEGSDSRAFAEQACRASGFEPNVGFESPDPSLHRKLVDAGVAAAFLPASVAQGLPENTRNRQVVRQNLSRQLVALYRRGTQNKPALQAALGAVEQAARAVL
jgi:DNA-binding transcriptional LysR family regulator